jgi:hypothetical protein
MAFELARERESTYHDQGVDGRSRGPSFGPGGAFRGGPAMFGVRSGLVPLGLRFDAWGLAFSHLLGGLHFLWRVLRQGALLALIARYS